MSKLRDFSQEVRELGARGTLFRMHWEVKGRLGLTRTASFGRVESRVDRDLLWTRRLPFADAPSVASALDGVVDDRSRARLADMADAALAGRILAFGRWSANYGQPTQWPLNPLTSQRWPDGVVRDIGSEAGFGDVKFAWEIGRFPHAYHLARAASFVPGGFERWASGLVAQMESFVAENPQALGVHWTSGQEVAFRLLAWLFALDICVSRSLHADRASRIVADALLSGAHFIEEHLDYARLAVYNNHLLSEAVALFGVGALLSDAARSAHWRVLGRQILDEEAERQFYEDGGYIQQSHNYHRVALQDLLWACAFAKSSGDRPSNSWLRAMERSLDLLIAHLNPSDGRLPNYGPNDGSHPSPLSSCDFSDFRPTLQAVSLATRGERLFDVGPWDEEAAWFLGTKALDAPLRRRDTTSVSFGATGHHVLRGVDAGSFSTFRCGTLRDRFSQIDMLHVDIWWRGHNVLVDGGSYSYNGPREWHNHFMRTASHNTVTVDGRDQMLHFRQFKVLYWTKAQLLQFVDTPQWALCAGEHYGYRRHDGDVVHRRSVLFVKDDVWIIADQISGTGSHDVRLHWLCGDYPQTSPAPHQVQLGTDRGPFSIGVFDGLGTPMAANVAQGEDRPPRGWLSRYYGEKVPVPSMAVERSSQLPLTMVSILAGTQANPTVDDQRWSVSMPAQTVAFVLNDGLITDIEICS